MIYYKRSFNLFGVALAVMVVLSSCQSNRNLPKPEVNTQALYRDANAAATDTTTIADIPWKGYFTDVKLQALIQEGIDNNYDMLIAKTRIDQAEASLQMARAALFPTLAAGVQTNQTRLSAGTEGTKVLGYSSPSSSNMVGFTATWEIDVWGKLNHQKKAKVMAYMNSHEYRTLIQTNIVSNVASAYYNLLALDEQLMITRQTAELLKSSAESMDAMKEAGMQTGAAVESSKALLYSTQLSIPVLESQIRKQENAICVLLGRVPGPVDRSSLAAEGVPASLSVGVPVQLLSRRPDVKQAENSFRQAYAMTKAAKASLYPSFNISSASLGFAGEFSDMFNAAHIAGNLVASVMEPVFNKKQIRGNIKMSQAQQEEALLNFKSTVLKAGQEVSNILDGYQASLRKNDLRQQQVASLTHAVDYTQELLKAGEASYIEVLNAQQSLLSAQLNQVNDKLEQLNYSVSLYKALGGGTK